MPPSLSDYIVRLMMSLPLLVNTCRYVYKNILDSLLEPPVLGPVTRETHRVEGYVWGDDAYEIA